MIYRSNPSSCAMTTHALLPHLRTPQEHAKAELNAIAPTSGHSYHFPGAIQRKEARRANNSPRSSPATAPQPGEARSLRLSGSFSPLPSVPNQTVNCSFYHRS